MEVNACKMAIYARRVLYNPRKQSKKTATFSHGTSVKRHMSLDKKP